jgi:hypothetical protein
MFKLFLNLLLISSFASTAGYAGGLKILERIYINGAWVDTEEGCFIDNDGDVYSYQQKPEFIREKKIGEMDKEKQKTIAELLSQARKGRLSEPENEMIDAGITKYRGYLYEEQGVIEVDLGQKGDVAVRNDSPAAAELILLLDGACPE